MSLDPTPTTIRFASRSDALAIAVMSRDLIEKGLGWSWTKERVMRSIRHPDSNVVIAMRDTDRAGFGIMKYDEDEAHLLLLAVQPGFLRRGVGSALVGWLEQSARVAGIARISLEARYSNVDARNFYSRLGYSHGEMLPGYYGGREASVRMAKELGPSRQGIA